jgi:hypothetical protein
VSIETKSIDYRGIDVGWLVGLVVAGSVYLGLTRSLALSREAPAIRDSEQILSAIVGR